MRYLGGKAKLAKRFLPIVLANRKLGQYYVEPFLGGCNVLPYVDGPRIASDDNFDLMLLYRHIQGGNDVPSIVTEEEYQACRSRPDDHAPWLRAFIGIGCSFGAKPWGGYARGNAVNGTPRNYAQEARASLLKIARSLGDVSLVATSYQMVEMPAESIIYCDPPYAGTTGYGGKFDHAKFWDWAERKRHHGHSVFVSEYTAPPGWKCVWEHEHQNSIRKKAGASRPVERLFTL